MKKNAVVLIILDGFGLSPIEEGNAVIKAKTPFFDSLLKTYPTTSLHASGQEVGLEFGEMGNSEVGHMNLGTGRVVMQVLPRINQSINNKSFFDDKELLFACQYSKKNNSILHLVGMVSTGGVHSHINHLFALIDLAITQKIKKVAIHIITDGRDTPPKKALDYIQKIDEKIKNYPHIKIATVCGRFYAMDRDNHWQDRTRLAYDLYCLGKGQQFDKAIQAVESSYNQAESDENISPKIINKDYIFGNNDSAIFYNFRSDRMIQISQSITDPKFSFFKRERFSKDLLFTSFTNYGFEPTKMVKIAFFSQEIKNPLAEVIGNMNLSQLHMAETEKYAHVTYFFNGGVEKPFNHENRILVPSPRVTSYDQKPEMSAKTIAAKFISYFKSKKPDFTVMNFANPDMVGHTGNLAAAIKGIEVVDMCLKDIFTAINTSDNSILVTADHGNAEQMINPQSKEIDKEHTTNPVPFVFVRDDKKIKSGGYDKLTLTTLRPTAVISDVCTTVIDLLEIRKPKEMTGQSLKDII